jgi:hypothetical protein
MKKVTRVFAAKSGTILVAVLAMVAGVQLAALAYDPYQDGFDYGQQCANTPDPIHCAATKCVAAFNNSPDTCASTRCMNGAIRYFDRTDGNPRDTWLFLACPESASL